MLRLLSGSGVTAAFALSRSWAKLLQLAGSGDAASVEALLLRQPRLQAPGSLETVWHEAARKGDVSTLTCLWQAGQHCQELRGMVDALNQRGNSPLMTALKRGHGKAALWFLAQGAQPYRWDALRRCSSIHLAARGGSEEACAALLDRVPEPQRSLCVNSRTQTCGVRPIHYAAAFGHALVVRLLLQCGADPTAVFKRSLPGRENPDYHAQLEGRMVGTEATALHLAAVGNDKAVAAELLDHYMTSHDDSLIDPRTITIFNPGPALTNWNHTASRLVSGNSPLLLALLRPNSDLPALLASHPRGHAVPILAALAAAAMRQGLVAAIDAVEGEMEFRRSSLPQMGGGGGGGGGGRGGGRGGRGGGGASGTTRQASLPMLLAMDRRGSGGSFCRRTSLPGGRVRSGSGVCPLAAGSRAVSVASRDCAAAADSGVSTPTGVSRRSSGVLSGAGSFLLLEDRDSATSATWRTASLLFGTTFWRRTSGGGGGSAATATSPDVESPKASASLSVFAVVCVAQDPGADDSVVDLEGNGDDGDSDADEELRCSVCLCNEVELQVQGCKHRLCCDCMRTMAVRAGNIPLLCPLCRGAVKAVEAL